MSLLRTPKPIGSNRFISSYTLTIKSTHHGFCPWAHVPAGWLFRNIDLQVAVGWIKPPGPFSLLFLRHKLEGAPQAKLTIFWRHSRHCGGDFDVVLRPGFFTDNGVPVRMARSVSLARYTRRKYYCGTRTESFPLPEVKVFEIFCTILLCSWDK